MNGEEISETRTEAYIDGIWYAISRNRMTYNSTGRRITSENLAGQVTTTAWDQFACTTVGELISASKLGGSQPSATEYAYSYDDIGNRLTSLDLGTNRVYSDNELNQYTAIADVAAASSPSQNRPRWSGTSV